MVTHPSSLHLSINLKDCIIFAYIHVHNSERPKLTMFWKYIQVINLSPLSSSACISSILVTHMQDVVKANEQKSFQFHTPLLLSHVGKDILTQRTL